MNVKELEKRWKKKDSLWLIPSGLTTSQKTQVKKAIQRTENLEGIIWFSSSGSTKSHGIKFYGHTRTSLQASAQAVNQHFKVSKKDRILNPLPLYHVGGFGTWLRARDAKCEWHDHSGKKWNPREFHQTLTHLKISFTSLVPTQVYDLIELKLSAPSSLKVVIVGGGALNKKLWTRARELGWPVFVSYGMTEFGSQIATGTFNDPFTLKILKHIGKIQQKKQGTWISSSAACTFQLEITKNKEYSLELKNRKYGILIEDLIEVNERTQTLKVLGRKSRVVKVLGELVSLDEVEKILGISEAAVISNAHPRAENELILVVERKNAEKKKLFFSAIHKKVTLYNQKAIGFKRIGRIEFIDQLPRTDIGKIKYSALAGCF